jgi:inosine/xanthosine triphosphatase
MKIAVGSKNPVKIEAVRLVVARVWPEADIVPLAVPSGVAAMPMSDADCLAGARNRAKAAQAMANASLGVGLEGGVNPEPAGLMLLGWVAVVDGRGRQGVGGGARLPLPAGIAGQVLAGAELGPLMDELLGQEDVKRKGGAVGALTGGLVLRTDAFAMAVAYALAPFVSPRFYDE